MVIFSYNPLGIGMKKLVRSKKTVEEVLSWVPKTKMYFEVTQSFHNGILKNQKYTSIRYTFTRDLVAVCSKDTTIYLIWELGGKTYRLHNHMLIIPKNVEEITRIQRLQSYGNQVINIRPFTESIGWLNYMHKTEDDHKKDLQIWKPLLLVPSYTDVQYLDGERSEAAQMAPESLKK